MEEYKYETKVGQKVYLVNLNIRHDFDMDNKTGWNEHGIFVTELKIIQQTKYKIALSDEWITLIDRRKKGEKSESYYNEFEKVSVRFLNKETYFPNGIFCSCYTLSDPKKSIKKIKSEILKKINKDYGWLRIYNFESRIEEMEIIKQLEK